MKCIAVAVVSAAVVVGLGAGTARADTPPPQNRTMILPPFTCKKGYHREWIPTGNGTVFRYVCVPNHGHKHSK